MKVNDQFTTTLPKPNMDGICNCMISKNHVFVRHGIENEKVKIKITKKIKEGFVGEITQILKPSPYRTQPTCPHSNCGGCSYNHMDYESQCILKQEQIKQLYEKENILIHEVNKAENPREYRNKCIFTFQKIKKQIKFGFYEENSHYVIDIKNCLNHDELTMKILNEIKKIIIDFKLEVYDEDNFTGIFRHVLIRRAVTTNQTLVCFVLAKEFKGTNNFIKELVKRAPEITTIVFNYNPRRTSVVLGDKERIMYGKGYILDTLCGNTYKLSANTFYQINHDQTEKLYQKAIELCNFKGHEKVLDMYCGIGTIGMSFAHLVKEVIGVELNSRSIKDAINNAKMNDIKNIHFVNKDATEFMKEYAKKKNSVDVVIMDPPRSGSTPQFIKDCISMNPQKILYISCDPRTQYRDLKEFRKYGYDTNEVHLFDLFPFSSHVESIQLLTKKG